VAARSNIVRSWYGSSPSRRHRPAVPTDGCNRYRFRGRVNPVVQVGLAPTRGRCTRGLYFISVCGRLQPLIALTRFSLLGAKRSMPCWRSNRVHMRRRDPAWLVMVVRGAGGVQRGQGLGPQWRRRPLNPWNSPVRRDGVPFRGLIASSTGCIMVACQSFTLARTPSGKKKAQRRYSAFNFDTGRATQQPTSSRPTVLTIGADVARPNTAHPAVPLWVGSYRGV